MKILLVNFTDSGGGAATAALRLVTALNENGIYARLGVVNKQTNCSYVIELPKKKHNLLVKIFRKISTFANNLFHPILKRLPNPFRFQSTNAILHTTNLKSETDIKWINNSDFDIINLHWISGAISIKDISKIIKPIVWTMHDSWPCCGAEHHPNILEADTRWKEGYYKNNKPKTTKGVDLCRKVWNKKKKYLGNKKITFIAPSKWEYEVLKSSSLFGHCECKLIPNIINHSVFCPKDKKSIRNIFNIPNDKIILGFGAAYDIDNPKSMKGSYYLLDALQNLKNQDRYFIIIFGPASDAFTNKIQIPFFASGFISNPIILASLYNACDCVINPSLIENLPTTCLESICCGVPVVAFDVGGTSDIVVHKQTGYLANPYKSEQIAEGIEWCIQKKEKLYNNCIEKSLTDFNTEKTVDAIINVYKEMLK